MSLCDAPGLQPLQEAIDAILGSTKVISDVERLALNQASGRILAEDVHSAIAVPPNDNSAMDGYAMRAADIQSQGAELRLIGRSLAGNPFSGQVSAGTCVRVTTGAVIPEGADTVVMQEQTQPNGESVVINVSKPAGNSIRKAGEDISKGGGVAARGQRLTPALLALIASVGQPEVIVYRKPVITVMATGDELLPPGSPLTTGAIYESNRVALLSALSALPIDVIDGGILADDINVLTAAFNEARSTSDLVITSGGVSVGDADLVKDVLAAQGDIGFWKVAIKPGKPFAFGHLGKALFCGLPGNPVSSYVTFQMLVMPLINKLMGTGQKQPLLLAATTTETLRKRPGRKDFQRGIFHVDENGTISVRANGPQGSGIMSSVTGANCYILLEQEAGNVETGETVLIQPFSDAI